MILQTIYLIIPAGDKIWAFFFRKKKIVKVEGEKKTFLTIMGNN